MKKEFTFLFFCHSCINSFLTITNNSSVTCLEYLSCLSFSLVTLSKNSKNSKSLTLPNNITPSINAYSNIFIDYCQIITMVLKP